MYEEFIGKKLIYNQMPNGKDVFMDGNDIVTKIESCNYSGDKGIGWCVVTSSECVLDVAYILNGDYSLVENN